MLDKFFLIDVVIAFVSFVSFVILSILRKKNVKISNEINKHYENLKIDINPKEDNDLRMFEDDSFNKTIMYLIDSFIPFLNIFLVYSNIHQIWYILTRIEEDSNEEKDKE